MHRLANHDITLPGLPDAMWDELGNPITPAQEVRLDIDPIYIEWDP